MTYKIKPLSCDPSRIRGMSERLIISHYENNYGGAVKRLNLIEEELAKLDYTKAAGFLINGLKREQLIAMSSMILHEIFFDGLGEPSEPDPTLHRPAHLPALQRPRSPKPKPQPPFLAVYLIGQGETIHRPGIMILPDTRRRDAHVQRGPDQGQWQSSRTIT